MSAGLFSTHHQQTHDFKNPSLPPLAAADPCSNGATPKAAPFNSSGSPSAYNISTPDPTFHSLNLRYNAFQAFPLDASTGQPVSASKLRSFNGELNLQALPPASAGDPSGYQRAPSASTHILTTSAVPSSGAPQLCMDHISVGSSTSSTFTANLSQKSDLDVRNNNAANQATSCSDKQQLSSCDYAERIQELRAALLRRSVSKPAVYMQNGHHFDLQAGCNWGEQQHLEENASEVALGSSSASIKGVLQDFQEDDQHTNYLGRLRVAAASAGSLTNQIPQKPNFSSNFSDQAKLIYCPNQASQAPALSMSFKKSPSGDLNVEVNNQGNSSNGVKETTVAGVNKAISAGSFAQSRLQSSSVISSIDQASTMGDFRRTACKGDEDTARDFMKVQPTKSFAKGGTDTNLQCLDAGESIQDNAASSHPKSHGSTQAEQPVSTLDQVSLGGFINLYQSSPPSETAFHASSTDFRPYSAGSLGHCGRPSTFCTSTSSLLNKKFADSFSGAANYRASVVGQNQEKQTTVLSKDEVSQINSNKLTEIQAAHELLRDCGNGNVTEFESLQEKAAAAGVPDPLHADAYIGDLQRFLPSNDEEEADHFAEEELNLEGALFGSDEFRMYEFKVRLCMRERSHDWTQCPFAHPGEKARRRDPRLYPYSAVPCPDFRKAACKRGDGCELSHGVFECWLHPTRYRTQICKDGKLCKRKVCFFAHSPSQFRAISSSSYTSTQKQESPNSSLQSAQYAQSMPLSQSFDGSSLRLLQHLPRYYVQALLKQDLNSSQIPDPHLNLPTIMPTLINHPLCQHQYYGGMQEAAASLPVSFDSSPLRLAMAYGLPINVDAATLGNVNSNCQSVSSPRSLNLPSRLDSFGSSNLLQDSASASGFLRCKGPPATNYVNVDDFVSMHSHNSYGRANLSVPHLQTDSPQMRALQAASLDCATRPMILRNGEVCTNGFIPVNKLALSIHNSEHQIGLPSSNLHPLMFSNASPNWNSMSSPPLPRFMPAPSLDAISQAQAVLTAHALAQNRASEHHMPSSPTMSQHARHHLDIFNNGTQGATIPVTPLNNVEYVDDQHRQNAGRGLDSPQAMSQLLASIQQLELRCATAEMKNNLMMAQAAQQQSGTANNSPSIANSNVHQLESNWEGPESSAGSCHRVDVGGSLKGAGMCGMVRQGLACMQANVPDHKGSFDLGWVDELI